MATLTTAQLRTLLTPPAAPCVSIYLPTHRGEPLRREDPIRFRNLADRVEQALGEQHKSAEVRPVVEQLRRLESNTSAFWRNTLDGAAVFAAPGYFETFHLPRAVPELAVVSDSFHVKPLLRHVQSADRFHVLGISRTEATLWEGNRYGLHVVPNALPTFAEAVGAEWDVPQNQPLSEVKNAGRDTGPNYDGHAGGKAALDARMDQFFRTVDRAMIEKHSNPTGMPVVLVMLTDNLGEFRKITQNRFVLDDAIMKDPGSFTNADELRAAAWKLIEPRYLDRLAKMVDDYNTAFPRLRATGNVADVAKAARDGRVGYLMVDADKHVPGRIDPESGDVRPADGGAAEDVIDDIAELTLRTGGEVVVVPSDRMPTESGLAAIFRF